MVLHCPDYYPDSINYPADYYCLFRGELLPKLAASVPYLIKLAPYTPHQHLISKREKSHMLHIDPEQLTLKIAKELGFVDWYSNDFMAQNLPGFMQPSALKSAMKWSRTAVIKRSNTASRIPSARLTSLP